MRAAHLDIAPSLAQIAVMRLLLILPCLVATACLPQDETIAGFVPKGASYTLQSINSTPFPHRATISTFEPDRIAGAAPCNRYSARQSAPYPWIEISDVISTRMACPELAAETLFLSTLSRMTIAEVSGRYLVLTNDADEQMTFIQRPAAAQ